MKIGSEILWLSETDVESLLTMPDALVAVGMAFRLHGLQEVNLPPKVYLTFEPFEGDLRAMPAYVKGSISSAGIKIVNSNAANPEKNLPAVTGILVLIDPETGMPLGVFGAGALTAIRTGAAGGIAAKYCARKNSETVGLVGCGRQARTQLAALLALFKIKKVLVWGKTEKESDDFCQAHRHLSVSMESCSTIEKVCIADIVVTTTPAKHPVVKRQWIKPGTHINAIGADAPGKQELETSLLTSARVIVDEWQQASHAGEVNVAVASGLFSEKDMVGQLGEIIVGKKIARTNDKDITVFDSTGLAIQDMAVAKFVYEKAVKTNKGQVLKLYG